MREFSISLATNEIIFSIFSVGVLIFSLLATLSKDTRLSIINFFLASFFLSCFIVAISNTIVASTIAIVYISVSGLLLITASNDYNHQQRVNKKAYLSVVIPIPLVMLLLYKKTSIVLIGKAEGLNYRELFGITLVISLIFIFIISGLISLFSKEN